MVWYGIVWYGMVWYGMVWCGVVWFAMVWILWYEIVMHYIMFSCFVLYCIHSQVRSCVLLLVTCNPVLPVSWSSCRRLNWHPHLGDQGRWVPGYPSRIKNKTCRRADELLESQRPTQAGGFFEEEEH